MMLSRQNRKTLDKVLDSKEVEGPNKDLVSQQVGVSIYFIDIFKISLQYVTSDLLETST